MGIIKFPTESTFLTTKSCVAINYGLRPFAKACWITFPGNNSVPAATATFPDVTDFRKWCADADAAIQS